jgi:hypothetical protein
MARGTGIWQYRSFDIPLRSLARYLIRAPYLTPSYQPPSYLGLYDLVCAAARGILRSLHSGRFGDVCS